MRACSGWNEVSAPALLFRHQPAPEEADHAALPLACEMRDLRRLALFQSAKVLDRVADHSFLSGRHRVPPVVSLVLILVRFWYLCFHIRHQFTKGGGTVTGVVPKIFEESCSPYSQVKSVESRGCVACCVSMAWCVFLRCFVLC